MALLDIAAAKAALETAEKMGLGQGRRNLAGH